MFTSDVPKPSLVLQPTSTSTPPSVLTQGMTDKEREIFYRLFVDLFVDNPRRKKPQAKEGRENNENISPTESNRPAKPDNSQTTTDEKASCYLLEAVKPRRKR